MIQVINKQDCCGCSACIQKCPKHCISFEEDDMGFRYPYVNEDLCINCHLCEQVCPCINQAPPRIPVANFAVKNADEEIRLKSSSGGTFSIIAEKIISEGGVVFGAAFDNNWEVHHIFIEDKSELYQLRGSKYVQSRIENTFKEAESFLKLGRKVLYSGTSCQIAGLKRFLGKEYNNLWTLDVICHGVPSPLVWRDYLSTLPVQHATKGKTAFSSMEIKSLIKSISFRDKSNGWKKYGFVIYASCEPNKAESSFSLSKMPIVSCRASDNIYMKAFLKNLSLRPSCYNCPAKSGKCESDFSLADFWAIDRYAHKLNDDKGITLVIIGSKRGQLLFESLGIDSYKLEPNKEYNRTYSHSPKRTPLVDKFWHDYRVNGISCIEAICSNIKPSFKSRIEANMRNIIKKIILH